MRMRQQNSVDRLFFPDAPVEPRNTRQNALPDQLGHGLAGKRELFESLFLIPWIGKRHAEVNDDPGFGRRHLNAVAADLMSATMNDNFHIFSNFISRVSSL